MSNFNDFDLGVEETCHQEIQNAEISNLIANPTKTEYGNQIDEAFNAQCTGKRECSFNIVNNAKWTYSQACSSLISQRRTSNSPAPRLMALASCEIDDIFNPYTGNVIRKNEFGFVVVIFDLLVCIAMFAFVYCLSKRQKQYVEQFKDQTIEMTDFSMSISNLPLDDRYGDNEEVLRAYLTSHYEEVLKDY